MLTLFVGLQDSALSLPWRNILRDKRAKFVKLANQRVTRALEQIRLIGNLSNRAAYDFSDADTKKIIKALQRAVDTTKSRFSKSGGAPDQSFSLD